MPDRRLAIVGSALDSGEGAVRLADLKRASLPNSAKFLVTRGKFDTEKEAIGFNIDSGYPAEIPRLQSLAAASGHELEDDPRFRDGFDLFCIRRLIGKHGGFDALFLLRDGTGRDEEWTAMMERSFTRPFRLDASGLLLNLSDSRCEAFLGFALDMYLSGSAYANAPYTLEKSLTIASAALDLIPSVQPAAAG